MFEFYYNHQQLTLILFIQNSQAPPNTVKGRYLPIIHELAVWRGRKTNQKQWVDQVDQNPYIIINIIDMITSMRLLSQLSINSIAKSLTGFGNTQKGVYFFAAKTINLPFLADSINEGTVAKILKKQGDWVDLDETVANIQTDKVTVQIKSPNAGVLSKFHVKEGDNLNVGKPFFDVDTEGKKTESASKPTQTKQQKVIKAESNEKKQSKPEPQQAVRQEKKEQKKPAKQQKKEVPKPQPKQASGQRKQTRESLSRLRQRVAQRLKQSQNNYALLTTFQEVDMLEAQNTRKALGEDFLKKYNVKLGFMSFFIKAATLALQEYPVVNSVIDGNQIVRRNYVDISIAVATPTGLMVPVLRNCQSLKFHEMEQGMADLAKKGKDGKISIEDMQGGTFTISNGGTFGSLMGTPILNPPQSAILGMHSIIDRPVVRDGQIVARPMMYLALTYDHRLLDGKDAVLFLKSIQTSIQDPRRMLLEI